MNPAFSFGEAVKVPLAPDAGRVADDTLQSP
jgi:hypothetical protein